MDCICGIDLSSSLTDSYLSQQKRKEREAAVMKNTKLTQEQKANLKVDLCDQE